MEWGEDLSQNRWRFGTNATNAWKQKPFTEKVDDLLHEIPIPDERELIDLPVSAHADSSPTDEPSAEEIAAAYEERFEQNLTELTEGTKPTDGQHGSRTVEQFLASAEFLD